MKKRILIMEVSGECRHVRVVKGAVDMEDGYYCAACPHSGWERIDPKKCETCTRPKYLMGITREEAIQKLYTGFFRAKDNGSYTVKEMLAEALNELLGKK